MSKPTRPLLRYYGGKWRIAEQLIALMPPHRVYTEAFGGGASVLLRKRRATAEIYNDLDGAIVNLFRVVRETPAELARAVHMTPYARTEYELDHWHDDPVEWARRTMLRSAAGYGGYMAGFTGFRGSSSRSYTSPGTDWANMPSIIMEVAERMRGVMIENMDAAEVIRAHDSAGAVHLVDPPYMTDTRTAKNVYTHEMDDDQHADLLGVLCAVKGGVLLCGYANALYDDTLRHWGRLVIKARDGQANEREEIVWLSPSLMSMRLPLLNGGKLR